MVRVDHCWSNSLLVLALFADDGSDSVHIGSSLGGKGLAANDGDVLLRDVLGSANELGGFELLEAVADVLTGGKGVVLSAGTVLLVRTVVLAEGLDTNLLSHVELVSDGGSTGVQPVIIVGSELSHASGLGIFGPGGDLDLVTFLQMLSESEDKFT